MTVRITQGDVREILPTLAADSFDCIVTSPPYYGLRDYGTATWEGGDPKCEHRIGVSGGPKQTGQGANGHASKSDRINRAICKCGARRIDAQIGLEPTLDEYLETIVAVCRELRRVLKPSGVMFFNIGDSYFSSVKGSGGKNSPKLAIKGTENYQSFTPRAFNAGNLPLKPKDLCLVPERLGIALQADGWWVRSHIIWHKLNPMPESVTDRPANAHETIWMLTKSARYFWDSQAVAEPVSESHGAKSWRKIFDSSKQNKEAEMKIGGIKGGNDGTRDPNATHRTLRNVWSFASHPFPGAHFATMPPEIAERCIMAACPPGGQVLDPFAGAGTTGLVADRLGRDATLIDLNTAYAEMALNRIRDDCPLFAEVAAE
jgi:DNA modification methylase